MGGSLYYLSFLDLFVDFDSMKSLNDFLLWSLNTLFNRFLRSAVLVDRFEDAVFVHISSELTSSTTGLLKFNSSLSEKEGDTLHKT